MQTGDQYSVALSVLFYTEASISQAYVYQANHYLRKLGLTPHPPGKSKFVDRLKGASIELFSKRNPQTKAEIIRSGITRINSLTNGLKI